MGPLLLVLSLWGPSSPAPRITTGLVPRLRPPFTALSDAASPTASAPEVPFTFALGEAVAGAGALVVGETVYAIGGFGILAALGFPGVFSSLTGAQVALVVPLILLGFVGFPALTAGAAFLTGRVNGYPRRGNYFTSFVGALVGAGLAAGGGLLYTVCQQSFSLSGAPETTAALVALAFQLVVIPVGAVIGLHWGVEDAASRPGESAPSPSTPPQLLPPPSVLPDSPAGPPSMAVPRAAAHVTLLTIRFG